MEDLLPLVESQGLFVTLHPMVVHFPIAYVATAIFSEAAWLITRKEGFRLTAQWLVFLGAGSALIAAGAGWVAAETLGHDSPGHDLVHDHRDVMLTFTALLTVVALALTAFKGFRRGAGRKWLAPLLVALVGVMGYGADKGGNLVYRHGVGGAAMAGQATQPAHHSHGSDHDHTEAGMPFPHHDDAVHQPLPTNQMETIPQQVETPHTDNHHHQDSHTHE
ncbi:DUF2231 domain-containing protein [Magnetofaba australis]|uniref:DUF2231 domain-containing protein n=1 Tax=Magnetofaba australis IT-1 TaxID=1434232 RepID=A0A1Y2K4E1_9PROT|nr:DUF2231 domain-containing protein [Magnetofaba australis]OSM04126.1 hypothetical protein MAIT1_03600 [Magnetofaba australis IT-1]